MRFISIIFCSILFGFVGNAYSFTNTIPPSEIKTFPSYGNKIIADCTFAAAANWEYFDLGMHPNEYLIEQEFYEAGGDETGLSENLFNEWWENHGIDGLKAHISDYPGSQIKGRIGLLLKMNNLLLGVLHIPQGEHMVLITKVKRRGVIYITLGTEQMISWNLWEKYATNVYTITPISNQ